MYSYTLLLMENFKRLYSLIGEKNAKKLAEKNLLVFGIGGVGGYVCEGLARCGIKKFTLVDFDIVSESNINRQIIALNSKVGMKKVELMKERILDINNEAKISCVCEKIDSTNIDRIDFSKYDYVVDAIDMVTTKLIIIERAKASGVKIISCMGTGNKTNPDLLQISDISKTSMCPLAKIMRKELKDRGIKNVDVIFSTEEIIRQPSCERKVVPSSIVFVPSIAGLKIAHYVVENLLKD